LNPRPLVLRFGAIGDMVLLTALLSALHRRWHAPVDVAVRSELAAQILEGLPEVGEVKVVGSRKTPYLLAPGQWRFLRWLRARAPGPAWVIDLVPRVSRLLERGGIGRSLQVREVDHPWHMDQLVHHRDWLLQLAALDPAGVAARPPLDGPPPRPHLVVRPDETADCEAWLRDRGLSGAPIVVVQTESRRLKRGRWPTRCWVEVLGRILEQMPAAYALVVGAPRERETVQELVTAIGHPRVRFAAGELPLRHLIALLDRAHSCLSLDTGTAHIAAAVGCPVVVVVGPVHPGLYRPIGRPELVELATSMAPRDWPSDYRAFCREHNLASVEPAAVLGAWERVARRGAAIRANDS
jgi:heptosyltransferase-2/heptosyltransferase-3